MISRKEADEVASNFVQEQLNGTLEIKWERTLEKPWGWVYHYGPRPGGPPVAGGGPFIIERATGKLLGTGTARRLDHYIQNYEFSGDPHVGRGSSIELVGWREGAEKVAAIRSVQKVTGLSLAKAKTAIDACLEGRSTVLETESTEAAALLISSLDNFGFSAKHLPERSREVPPTRNQSLPR